MHTKIPSLKNLFSLGSLALVGLLMASCSSTHTIADNDGIYSNGTRVVVEEEPTDEKSNYYKQYFNTKSQQLEDIPEEDDLIFTDIESYTTTETVDDEGNIIIEEPSYAEEERYGSWGSNSGDVSINVINTGGFYGAGWYGGWYRPWGFGYFARPFWGWGGYYGGWGIGWGGFYGGWGGFYNPWYCAPNYGGYYGNNYGYAYNRGRSNSNFYRGRSLYNGGRNSIASRGRSSYSRSEVGRRSAVNRDGRSSRTRVNRGTTTRRSNVRTTRPNTRSTRSTRTTRPNTRTTRPNTRSTRSTRSTRPNTRSTRSSSNRSGSYNRGGSSRSSGARSGGGSRRGRG